jgi:integrase
MTTSVLHEVIENATNLAPRTRERYLRDLNAWIKFAGKDPVNWTRRKAQAFYASLLAGGLKAQSANRLMASLRYAAKWWAIQEDNPALNFPIVQEAKPSAPEPKQALTAEQAIAILNTCKHLERGSVDLRDFTMMVVGLETGMRCMSMQSMLIERCFLHGDAKTGYPTAHVLTKGSGTDRLTVPISDTALMPMFRWLHRLDSNQITHGAVFRRLVIRRGKGDDPTSHVPGPEALSESAIRKIFAERGRRARIELSPHVFRHTFVTWRMEAGYQAHEVAAVTGHQIRELGALGGYIDPIQVGQKMRESTPAWLAQLVASRFT